MKTLNDVNIGKVKVIKLHGEGPTKEGLWIWVLLKV